MNTMGIEETLLAYHKETGKNRNYTIVPVDKLPSDAREVRSVCLNGTYIQFYERINIEQNSSEIFWVLEFVKEY
ncbi:hypothetical protein [Aquimarina macrocephali]|uniref:hypothetical protein n=1 Tax=Aquimarina macrocephali TaxID=666563 RepID=UPI0004643C78|nr:hypothetical protein [Aquimarina macrocephali]